MQDGEDKPAEPLGNNKDGGGGGGGEVVPLAKLVEWLVEQVTNNTMIMGPISREPMSRWSMYIL